MASKWVSQLGRQQAADSAVSLDAVKVDQLALPLVGELVSTTADESVDELVATMDSERVASTEETKVA